MSPVHGARVRGSERAREREAKKIRGRNAGPLAPSSPWLQSLRGKGEGIMAPRLQRRPRPCNVPQACSLHPGTGSETPSPALESLPVLSPSLLGRGVSLSSPANAGRDLRLAFPLPPPSLLSHCDGTRGGKRGKAAARKVSLPVLGGVADQRRWESLNHEHTGTAQSPRQALGQLHAGFACLPHVFELLNVIFNIFLSLLWVASVTRRKPNLCVS